MSGEMTREDDVKAVVLGFNELINRRDATGLTALMTEDHVFIDSAGRRVMGAPQCREAWERFFAAFPDYRNELSELLVRGDQVIVTGRAVCRDARLDGPAIWAARVSEGRIAEWRVYEDSRANRTRLGLSD
jgi:ketosteroid isomerase-like protein